MSDLINELMGANSPTASFLEIGATHEGTVISYTKSQQRDLATGKPKFWDNGDPMEQWIFTLQTEENNPELPDDDGKRRVFATGSNLERKQMLAVIRQAIRKSGHKGDIIGGTLAVKFVGEGDQPRPGFAKPKLYSAKFEPPLQDDGWDHGDDAF